MKFEEINYDAVLADLQAKRGAIDNAIAAIRMLKGHGSGIIGSLEKPAESIPPNAFSDMSIPEAIRKYLSVEKRPRSTRDIAEALKSGGIRTESQSFYSTVSTALARMMNKENGVVKKGKKWSLREWSARKPATGTGKIEEGKSKEAHGEGETAGKGA